MASDNVPHDRPHEQPSAVLLPVHVDDIDRLNAIARNLNGLTLILGAASATDAALAAVETILRPLDDQLQEFKNWFDQAWRLATTGAPDEK